MKSVDDEVSSCSAMSEENPDNMLDDMTLQNLTEERKLRVELEREERKCANLKFQIENIQQQCLNIEDSNSLLRRTLIENQTEIEQICQEIRSQKEVIDDVCCSNRLQNFCDVMEAISRVANEYKQFKLLLNKEIQKCNSHYAEINEMKDEAVNIIDSIIASRNEQEDLINQVESNVAKLKGHLDVLSDEKIQLFEEEFEKYLAQKNTALTFETEKRNAEERFRQSVEEQEEVRMRIQNDLSNRFNECEAQFQDGISDVREEDQLILDHVEELKMTDTDEYDQIRLTLDNLKSEVNNLKEYIKTLEKQKQLQAKEVTLREHQVELKKQEVKLKQDIMKILKNKGDDEENTIELLQDQLDALDESISEVGRDIETLIKDISPLEMKLESFSHLVDEDVKGLENSCDLLKKERENSSRALANFRSEDELLEIIGKFTMSEASGNEECLQMDADSIKELERTKQEIEHFSRREVEETDQLISSLQEDIDASAINVDELELLLETLRKELQFAKEAHATKQFDVWALRRDNEQKRSDYDELDKKIVAETSNLERTRDLWRDLDRNSVPKSELPGHPLFLVYKKELGTFDAIRKKREKLEQEKKLLSEKLEKYEYVNYKTPAKSQNRSQI